MIRLQKWKNTSLYTVAAIIYTMMVDNGIVYAAQVSPGKEPDGVPEFSGLDSFDTFSMVSKVVFFLIIIIGLFYLLMKFISKKNNLFSGNRSFRSLGGIPLGPNKSVQVVEIGKSLYIVGVSETIQLLEKIDGADEVKSIKDMLLSPSSGSQGFQSFGGWLQSLRSSGKQAQEEEELDVSASFQQVFHSKLQNLSNRKKMVEDMLMEDKNLDRLNDK